MSGCIFCGGRPLSKEHIWPKWLRQYLSFDDDTYKSMTATIHRNGRDEVEKKHGGDLRGRGVRCVCISCNSGWMSALQVKAKPVVESMLDGRHVVLNTSEQSAFAAWVAMAVITAEQMDKTRIAVQPSDRRWLYENQIAPLHWGIWIAKHKASAVWRPRLIHHVIEFAKDGENIEDASRRSHNTQATTYKVGEVLIHAMSCDPFPNIVRDCRYDLMFPGKVARLWPAESSIKWPLTTISDFEAHYISTAFFENAHRIGSSS
jgi:hypothetical protein